MAGDSSSIVLQRRTIVGWLGTAAAFLVVAHITSQLMQYFLGHEKGVWLFNLDAESNLPTWFSSSLLLMAALLLSAISVLKRAASDPRALQWAVLACGFLFLSIDEATVIHERFEKLTLAALGYRPTGLFYFAWVIPAIGMTLIFALWFLNFFRDLPSHTRRPVLGAALLYVGGALGVELIGGRYYEQHGQTLVYTLITTIEESMEMAGVIVFIHALLQYIESRYGPLKFHIQSARRTEPDKKEERSTSSTVLSA